MLRHIFCCLSYKKKVSLLRKDIAVKNKIFFTIFKDKSSCVRILDSTYNHDKNNDHNLRITFLQEKNLHHLSSAQSWSNNDLLKFLNEIKDTWKSFYLLMTIVWKKKMFGNKQLNK